MPIPRATLLWLCLLLVSALAPQQLMAGAWTLDQGKSYNRLAANYYYADENFDASGDSQDMPYDGEFDDYNLNYYLEYGVTDRLTGILSVYYKDISKEDDYLEYETDGIGDIDVGLKYRLAQGDWGVLSLQGLVKLPNMYSRRDALPLGNGQYDLEGRLLYGRSLWPMIPGYVGLEAGYRLREEAPADEFRYLVEFGSELGADFYARGKLDGIIGLGNGDGNRDYRGNPTTTYEYDLTELEVTLGYQFTPEWGVEAAYKQALWGENTAEGQNYTLALTFQP